MAGWRPSQGNARDLHPIHPPHLQPHPPGWLLGFEDIGLLARMPLPHMRFLFVGPGLCLRLPSDSASRRTPLPSGYRFPPPGSEKDFHLQVTNQSPQLIGWRLRATRHAWRTNKKRGRADDCCPLCGLEAASGFEPENNGFADRCLSHLAMPPMKNIWSGRTDLNRRRPPWQGGTLPLSYARPAFDGA